MIEGQYFAYIVCTVFTFRSLCVGLRVWNSLVPSHRTTGSWPKSTTQIRTQLLVTNLKKSLLLMKSWPTHRNVRFMTAMDSRDCRWVEWVYDSNFFVIIIDLESGFFHLWFFCCVFQETQNSCIPAGGWHWARSRRSLQSLLWGRWAIWWLIWRLWGWHAWTKKRTKERR